MTSWDELQDRCVQNTIAAIARGVRRLCVTGPTGCGKTKIASSLIQHYLEASKKCSLYTNRKLLVEQTSRVLEAAGHVHGVRAAGYEDERWCDLQVSSIQTEHSRAIKKQQWALHDADLVIVDEAHLQKGDAARKILDHHHANGAAVVGLTATPIDLADLYDELIVAGTNSELRACGALVLALHYGPDEPDLKRIKNVTLGQDLTEGQQKKLMGQAKGGQADVRLCQLFGRVLEWFEKLNPEHRPTILFAPGVEESIWFAEQFTEAGIPAAHIDGQEVWINGRLEKTSQQARKDVLEASKAGDIRVLCNRFVLREGIDAPWLAHGILATVFGSLQSYLQSCGRLLRAYLGMASVSIQDHGGNWWRHGSVNEDRHWELEHTATMIAAFREERLRAKRDREPVRCPRCGLVLTRRVCVCGFAVDLSRKSRPVVQTDGSLREMTGDIFRPRRISTAPNAQQLWERMYFRAKSEKWNATFRQAEAMFAQENNWQWPSREMRLMPVEPEDFCRKVRDVPMDRLRR